MRCGTPSIAAAAVVPDRAGLQAALDGLLARGRGVAATADSTAPAVGWRVVEPRRALGQGVERAAHRLDRCA